MLEEKEYLLMKIIRKKNNQKSFKVYRELILKYRHSKPKQEKNIIKLIENPNLKFAKDARTSINYRWLYWLL